MIDNAVYSRANIPLDAKPYLSLPKMIRISTFVDEAREYLNTHFRGSWLEEPPRFMFTKHILVSEDCFAYFTKVIFKRIYNREPVTLFCSHDNDIFRITYKFTTSYLREDDLEKLALTAKISGFSFEYTRDSVTLSAPMIISAVLHVYAGTQKPIYNSFVEIFADDLLYPV